MDAPVWMCFKDVCAVWCFGVHDNVRSGIFKSMEEGLELCCGGIGFSDDESDPWVSGQFTNPFQYGCRVKTVWSDDEKARLHDPSIPSKGDEADA